MKGLLRKKNHIKLEKMPLCMWKQCYKLVIYIYKLKYQNLSKIVLILDTSHLISLYFVWYCQVSIQARQQALRLQRLQKERECLQRRQQEILQQVSLTPHHPIHTPTHKLTLHANYDIKSLEMVKRPHILIVMFCISRYYREVSIFWNKNSRKRLSAMGLYSIDVNITKLISHAIWQHW